MLIFYYNSKKHEIGLQSLVNKNYGRVANMILMSNSYSQELYEYCSWVSG